jgi:tetratricopeptide (TPR) repeat protein
MMRVRYLLPGLVLVSLMFFSGCASHKAVDSYVDAVMLEQMNENQQAITKLNQSVQYNPKFALAYSLMGDIYQKEKNLPKSASAYEKATSLNRWSYKDFFNLGKVYRAMSRYADAIKAYVRATQIQPNAAPAHLGAAESYYQLKDYKNALKYGKRAQQLDPNIVQVQALLGDIYISQKDYGPAINSYKRALELDANQPAVMNSLALAYLRSNKFEAAKELLTSSIEEMPSSIAYQHLGYANLKLQDCNGAVNAYRGAVELDPNDWSSHKGLGVALMICSSQKNDAAMKAEAIEEWKQSLELHQDQPRLRELVDRYNQ